MSTTTVKTDTTAHSKVLPGDKSGLPWEIWQMILSYLSASELCQVCFVNKTWNELVNSLDSTRWKELYLKCIDWRHPYWPQTVTCDPPSWKKAYMDQYISVRYWSRISTESQHTSCLYVLKWKKERKLIKVGPGLEHESLKSALAVANGYDRIEVYPGIYDEQFEMSSKIPFELVGHGELGSVILVVSIEQVAMTGRLNNLVFRAPWFTTFILKIRSGYLQVDNCILEDGMIYAQHPGTCRISFCTFRHATVILQHVNASIIENCEFSQSDIASVIVEGYSKEEKNWTFPYLCEKIHTVLETDGCHDDRRYSHITMKTMESQTSTIQSGMCTVSSFPMFNQSTRSLSSHKNYQMTYSESAETTDVRNLFSCSHNASSNNSNNNWESLDNKHEMEDRNGFVQHFCQHRFQIGNESNQNEHEKNCLMGNHSNGVGVCHDVACRRLSGNVVGDSCDAQVGVCVDVACRHLSGNVVGDSCDAPVSVCVDVARVGAAGDDARPGSSGNVAHRDVFRQVGHNAVVQPLRNNAVPQNADVEQRSIHSQLDDSDDDDTLSLLDDFGSGRSSSLDSHDDSSSLSGSDSDSEENILQTDNDEFSSSEDSVIMLPHLRMQHFNSTISANSVEADVVSVSSQTKPVSISFSLENLLSTAIDQIQGCLIRKCRMLHSKGGVVVSLQAHAVICECDISNVDYGIRCIQNARVVILKNKIHHCLTSGIFMRLAASGLIGGNDIHSNMEAGIDIRKNADPIIQSNRIHHGKRSGIVILGSGRGQIKKNEIFQNREAGVYVLYGGNPTISDNHIYDGRAAGVAINEGGRGLVFDNIIEGNQWGGVDIRHGGNPLVCGNSICEGVGDGIVIGERGQGSIENNIISGNAGCGVWIMSASQPYLHGNQISSNGDSGVLFVNKTDVQNIPHISDSSIMASSRSLLSATDAVHHNTCRCATVQYNNIYHNTGKGVIIQLGDEVHVCYNAIHANHSDGILVDQDAEVLLKGNSITNNNGSGVITSAAGKIMLLGNGIYHNEKHGIVGRCDVTISGNDVVSNHEGGICLEGCSLVKVVENRPEVEENRVQCFERSALSVLNVTQGSVETNKLFQEGMHTCIQQDTQSKTLFKNNHIVELPHTSSEGQNRQQGKSTFCKAKFLSSPAPRPVIEPPPPPSEIPLHNVSLITKITVPPGETCEQGSKFCVIL